MIFVIEKTVETFSSFHLIDIDYLFRLSFWSYFYYDRFFKRSTKSDLMNQIQELSNQTIETRISKIARKYITVFIGMSLFAFVKHYVFFDYEQVIKSRPFLIDNIQLNVKFVHNLWFLFCWYTIDNCLSLMIYEYLLVFKTITLVKLSLIKSRPTTRIRLKWRQICNLTDDFENQYSLAPFFKIINSYIGALTYIVWSTQTRQVTINVQFVTAILHFLVLILIDFYLIITIDKANRNLKAAANKLMEVRVTSSSHELKEFSDDINQSYRFKLTGNGLFKLEKSLLIGFGASLISFTVLFIQISTM